MDQRTGSQKQADLETTKKSPNVRFEVGFLVLILLSIVAGVIHGVRKHDIRAREEADRKRELEQFHAVQAYLAERPPALPSCASAELQAAAREVLSGLNAEATMVEVSEIEAESIALRRACRGHVFTGADKQEQHWVRYTVERAGDKWFVQFSDP